MNNKLIDHTLLKAVATTEQVKKICDEALEFNFKAVCVNPCYVKFVRDQLVESGVLVCTVIGFPLGANTIEVKVFETKDALKNGADEIDMVINIGKALEHDYNYLEREISEVVRTTHSFDSSKIVKVILETAYLNNEEIFEISKLCEKAGADFVKTSTGFATRGASLDDIQMMHSAVGGKLGIKASGGVKTKEDLEKFVKAGATRIGSSSGKELI